MRDHHVQFGLAGFLVSTAASATLFAWPAWESTRSHARRGRRRAEPAHL